MAPFHAAAAIAAGIVLCAAPGVCMPPQPRDVRVLVVTGGHDYEREPFLDVFRTMPALSLRHVEHPDAWAAFPQPGSTAYDALVLYDMQQDITEEHKRALLALLRRGTGLVVLHHALADYQQWPEFGRIVGGRYWLSAGVAGGVEHQASTYRHGVSFAVHVAAPRHPVAQGLSDWRIVDETYGGTTVSADVEALLTTDEPSSGRTIAWAHRYGRARVVAIALGHDHTAYEDRSFQRLLAQAIAWVAQGVERPTTQAAMEVYR